MLSTLSSFLFVSFLSLCQAIKITSDADPPSNFFLANQKLTLTCNSDGATTFNWTKLEIPSGAQVPLVSSSLLSSGSANSQYIFDPIKATDGGNYTCTDGTSFDTFALNVVADGSLYSPPQVFNGTSDALLQCYQSFSPPFPLIWYRPNNDTPIVSTNIVNKDDRSFVIKDASKNYSLAIQSDYRYPDKTGEYTCRVNTTGINLSPEIRAALDGISQTVIFQATPDVKIQGTGKSKSAIKGENFQLNCTVQGHTYGTDHIKWVHFNESDGKNNTLLDAPWSSLVLCKEEQDEIGGRRCHLDSNDSRISFKRDHEFEKYVNSANHSSGHPQNMISSILEINNVLDEDRGSYYCIAANGVGENGHSVIVRVKDRLAALWPFLGIVIEVILLCGIIFFFERRRSKSTVEEEDEAEPMRGELRETREVKETIRSRK